MNNQVQSIIKAALDASDPYENVKHALSGKDYSDGVVVFSVGKAACRMAKAAYDSLGGKIKEGYIITKYGHSLALPDVFEVHEAGHPIPDENTVRYTKEIIKRAERLNESERVLFLLSGGGSSLFECPLITLDEMKSVTDALLKRGADIYEMNTVRKHLSAVKGGRFAEICRCPIDCLVLSDVLGDSPEVIASGPCCADSSTSRDAQRIIDKYNIDLSEEAVNAIMRETPKIITNAEISVAGNIKTLCEGAERECEKLGYKAETVSLSLTGEARERGREIAEKAIALSRTVKEKTALIYGGETTVTVKGDGKGGRNQEMALAAAVALRGTKGITFFSLGSDGTDGPTDAAGGVADGSTCEKMINAGLNPIKYLDNNDSYNALKKADSLIVTGPTGTNVNDITGILID